MSAQPLLPPQPTERLALLRERPGLEWEGTGVSNPGVARLSDGSIAMLYRGCGSNNVGHLGFCRLDAEGRHVIAGTRSRHPLNVPSKAERIQFPGGYGDPRITRLGEWFIVWANGRNNRQMDYNRRTFGNDFAGQYIGGRQTVAFRTRDFSKLEYLGLHGPDEFDKNSFLHPDPVIIDGTPYLAFFHRVQYTIQVAYAPALHYLKLREPWRQHMEQLDNFVMLEPELRWEGVGADPAWPGSVAGGAPPLAISATLLPEGFDRTRQYWLMFYNASGDPREGLIARDRRVGAILFTTKDRLSLDTQPFEVVARSGEPLLTPQEPYEFDTPNGDVVFCTGALLTLDEQAVDVFYGSGDRLVSKARFDLVELITYICQFDEHGQSRYISQ